MNGRQPHAEHFGDHPGCFRVGPVENSVDTGFVAGLAKGDMAPSSKDLATRWGDDPSGENAPSRPKMSTTPTRGKEKDFSLHLSH